MKYLPNDIINVAQKRKIYFTSHPNDSEYLETIGKTILSFDKAQEFVILYESEVEKNQDFLEQLLTVQMIVIPVTDKFLCEKSFARDKELVFAQEHKIPVLMWLEEDKLDEEKYATVCGNIQYLNPGDKDKTTLNYEYKLKKCLEAFMTSGVNLEQIKNEFIGKIFLSYRKKDRVYAQQLINSIHSTDLEDWAIWYDEFLTPGENFNEEIEKCLEESDIFALLVTPNILEPDNYVMNEEYPAAVKADKPQIVAEAIKTEKKLLEVSFPKINHPINIKDGNQICERIEQIRIQKGIEKKENTPERLYNLGIAYLRGINVEINRTIGIHFLELSAEKENLEAIQFLAHIYRYGEGVEINENKSIEWLKKLVKLNEMRFNKDFCSLYFHAYINSFNSLSECLYDMNNVNGLKEQRLILEQKFKNPLYKNFCTELNDAMGQLLIFLADIEMQKPELEKAEELYTEAIILLTRTFNNSIYSTKAEIKSKCVFERASVFERVDGIDAKILWKLKSAYIGLGNTYELKHKFSDAEKSYQKAIKNSLDIEYDYEEGADWSTAELYLKLCNFYIKSMLFKEIGENEAVVSVKENLEKCKELLNDVNQEYINNLDEYFRKKNLFELKYNFCFGNLWYIKHNSKVARKYFTKCIDISKEKIYMNRTEAQEIMSEVYLNMGYMYEREENYFDAYNSYINGKEVAYNLRKHYMSIYRSMYGNLCFKLSVILKLECEKIKTSSLFEKSEGLKKIFEIKKAELFDNYETAKTIIEEERYVQDMNSFMGIGFRDSLDQILVGFALSEETMLNANYITM